MRRIEFLRTLGLLGAIPYLSFAERDAPLPISEKDRCLGSYYEFYKQAFIALHPKEVFQDRPDIKLRCESIQRLFQDMLDSRSENKRTQYRHSIYSRHRRSGSSLMGSVFFNAWVWLHRPDFNFLCFTKHQSEADTQALDLAQLIDSNWYQGLFSDSCQIKRLTKQQGDWTTVQTTKGGTRLCKFYGGVLTGYSADITVYDTVYHDFGLTEELDNARSYYRVYSYNRLRGNGMRIFINSDEIIS
jgi:hypothetical protein